MTLNRDEIEVANIKSYKNLKSTLKKLNMSFLNSKIEQI
jgi:hypothetical protein